MSFSPGVCRIWLLVWLLLLDWWPGIDEAGDCAETLNIEVWIIGYESTIYGYELSYDPGFYEFYQSLSVPRMATFFRCLPVAILFEPDFRRCSVLPLFSILI